MNKLYKASTDSYGGKEVNIKKMVGTWQLTELSKKGLKTHDSDRLMALCYYAYQANALGYDYVVMSEKRTNSGREEAVLLTAKIISFGKQLLEAGYVPAVRKTYDNPSKICKGDVRVPQSEEPKKYSDLPELKIAKTLDDKIIETHEDELLSLIDCMTGEGNKSKAFRAIARYLTKEAINIEIKGE